MVDRSGRTFGLMLMLAGLGACAADAPVTTTTVDGECATVHGAEVCTWATMQGDQVVEAGATIPVAVAENAPADMEMVWPPMEAAVVPLPEAAGIDHLTVYWEAHGHPPGPYLVPHFDFHFYTVPDAQRQAMDCSDLRKPAALPAAYILPDEEMPEPIGLLEGICVPRMGMHSLLQAEYESETPFRGTMVIGYYGGEYIFVEPMITREMLLERQSFDLPIPAIPGATRPVPTQFRAEYDAAADAYRFTFSGFGAV